MSLYATTEFLSFFYVLMLPELFRDLLPEKLPEKLPEEKLPEMLPVTRVTRNFADVLAGSMSPAGCGLLHKNEDFTN